MTPARTVLAVFLGYLAFLLVEVAGNLIAGVLLCSTSRGTLILTGELVTVVSAAIAGAVAARVASTRPLAHAGALGLAIFSVTAIASAAIPPRAPSPFPAWFPYVNAVLGGVGAFMGGAIVALREDSSQAG